MARQQRSARDAAHAWIRRNVLALVAIFLALNGTAVAVQVKGHGREKSNPKAVTASASVPKQLRKLKKQLVQLQKQVSGLSLKTGPQGLQGPQGPQGATGPSTGPAGGDLTGNYPNPEIAAGAITDAKVAAANKDGAAGVPSLRRLGTGALQAMPGNAQPGGPPTGAAGAGGGALAGSYPNPTLDVSGGPCANGEAVTNLSNQAALTCGLGIYSDGNANVAAGPNTFGSPAPGGGSSTAFGNFALKSLTTGNSNTAVGGNALFANSTGGGNTALGYVAGQGNTTGSSNTAIGYGTSNSNQTGNNNTAVGSSALNPNTASNNTAIGQAALGANTTGTENSAVGQGALDASTTANGNSAFGRNALGATTTGIENTALGLNALAAGTTGALNTAVGTGALQFHTTGNGNVALGFQAGSNLFDGFEANNIDIGTSVFGTSGESGTIRIGRDDSQTRAFIAGIRGVTTGATDAVQVVIDSAGQLGTVSSSRRVKRDIKSLDDLSPLMKLRPVSFRYRSGPPELHYGLIAEQVAKVLPELAVYGDDGRPETVQYQELPALLLAKIQDQQRQIKALRAETRSLPRLEDQVHSLMRAARGRRAGK